jgi:hypothetical protein
MQFPKYTRKVIAVVIFIIVNIAGFAYVYLLYSDYSIDPFSLSQPKTNLPIRLYYPSPENELAEPVMISLWFNVTANRTLAENVPIELTNFTGHVYIRNDIGVDFVSVGFYHTNLNEGHFYRLDPENKTVGPDLGPVGIYAEKGDTVVDTYFYDLIPWHIQPSFSFPVAGDYSPAIAISVSNHTIQHTYTEIKLHVASQSELKSQELAQIDVVIAVAVFAFADVEFAKLLYDFSKNREETQSKKPNFFNRFRAWANRQRKSK